MPGLTTHTCPAGKEGGRRISGLAVRQLAWLASLSACLLAHSPLSFQYLWVVPWAAPDRQEAPALLHSEGEGEGETLENEDLPPPPSSALHAAWAPSLFLPQGLGRNLSL